MFEEFERDLKKKLSALYQDFIENPEDKKTKEEAAKIAQRYANSGEYNLSPSVSKALSKAYGIEMGILSKDEAKNLLEELQENSK